MIYRGEVPTKPAGTDKSFLTVLGWARKFKNISVTAEAESYEDAVTAYGLGGEGVGFYRTAHMFSSAECVEAFRQYILSQDYAERVKYLGQLMVIHQAEFVDLFRATHNSSLTVCLLDKPLASFFPPRGDPQFDPEMRRLSVMLGIEVEECVSRVAALDHTPQVQGDRGGKLALLYPDIVTMQTMAFTSEFYEAHVRLRC